MQAIAETCALRVLLLFTVFYNKVDACLCMGELPAPPALPAPHFVFLMTFQPIREVT